MAPTYTEKKTSTFGHRLSSYLEPDTGYSALVAALNSKKKSKKFPSGASFHFPPAPKILSHLLEKWAGLRDSRATSNGHLSFGSVDETLKRNGKKKVHSDMFGVHGRTHGAHMIT